MAKLIKSHSKYTLSGNALRAAVGQKTYDEIHPVGTSIVRQEEAAKAAEQAVQDEKAKPVIPLPDEEELARQRRRQALRRSGRDSTVLTDTFGPG